MNRSNARVRRRDERGQIATPIVIMASTFLIALALLGVAALGHGTDEKSQAQSAADAAALAGAGALADELPAILGMLHSKGGLAGLVGCGLGQSQASTYASKNDASLTSYCFNLAHNRVEASVQMNDPVSDDVGPAVADAVASTGFDAGSCSWQDDPPPSPSPTPTPTESPDDEPSGPPPSPTPPPPPPDIGTTLTCGPIVAHFVIGGSSGLLTLVDVDVHGLEPRLVD